MNGHSCRASGRGVVGRGVRLVSDLRNRTAHIVAVRCVGGVHSYQVRDWEGRIIVYQYFEPVPVRELSQRALKRLPVAAMMRYLDKHSGPPLVAKQTRWVPASAVRFIRHGHTR